MSVEINLLNLIVNVDQEHDEIQKFIDARNVSASEVCSQCPKTIRLPVHFEDYQAFHFDDAYDLNEVQNTPLTQYFKQSLTDPSILNLYYNELPSHYVWNKSKRIWTPR